MTNLYRFADQRARRRIVSFDRRELSRLLSLYSLRVASGEWRDYAIDFRPGMAIFSIFRHTAEQPLYAIAKVPGAAQGGYMVYNGPRKLAHGESLEDVLARLRPQAAASAGLSYLLGVVAAPMPAPTAAPTSTGATSGQPANAPTARPVPAPMPPPVKARSPQVSPQAESAKASGSTITATDLVLMTDLKGDTAGRCRPDYYSQPLKAYGRSVADLRQKVKKVV